MFLGFTQVYGPDPNSFEIQKLPKKSEAAGTEKRELSLWEKTGLELSKDLHPVLGNAESERVAVIVFDYQCLDCRRVGNYLDVLMQEFPDRFAVVLVLVPLERGCTKPMQAKMKVRNHSGSCAISRSALAVWRSHPERFEEFHRNLIKDPNVDLARELAIEIMGEKEHEAAVLALAKERLFVGNFALWENFSKGKSFRLPKIWLNELTLLHGAPSSNQYFQQVMKLQLQLQSE